MDLYAFLRDPNATPSPRMTGYQQILRRKEKGEPLEKKRLQQWKKRDMEGRRVAMREERRELSRQERVSKKSKLLAQRRPGLQEEYEEEKEETVNEHQHRPQQQRDMRSRLEEFKLRRQKTVEDQKKKKRPPFRVGVYKLENNLTNAPFKKTPKTLATQSKVSSFRKGNEGRLPQSKRRLQQDVTSSLTERKKPKAAKALELSEAKGEKQKSKQETEKELNACYKSPITEETLSSNPTMIDDGSVAKAPAPSLDDVPKDLEDENLNSTVIIKGCVTPVRRSMRLADKRASICTTNLVGTCGTGLTPALEGLKIKKRASQMLKSKEEKSLSFCAKPNGQAQKDKGNQVVDKSSESGEKQEPFSFSFISKDEMDGFQFTATPKIHTRSSTFKNPLSTGKKRRVSAREFVSLLDPWRKDIQFHRGSCSSQRRRKKGKRDVDMEEILGLTDLDGSFTNTTPFKKPASTETLSTPLKELSSNKTPARTPSRRPVPTRTPSCSLGNTITSKAPVLSFGEVKEEIERMEDNHSSSEKNVTHFRQLLSTEKERITQLCNQWEAKLNEENLFIPEDARGQVRSMIGKAGLLMNRKGRFEQFSNLIDNCEFNRGDRPTTCTDLQGFWDMIYFQVEDVIAGFVELDRLQENEWEFPKEEESKNPQKQKKLISRPKPKIKAKASSSLKEMMAIKRKELKNIDNVQNLAKPSVGEKVFEGGFFNVRSPMRSLETTTRKSKRSTNLTPTLVNFNDCD